MSVHWPIFSSLVRRAARTMIIDENRSYKGVELLVASMHVASEIQRRCNTWTTAFMLPSSGASPIAALAIWALGKTAVPLNFLLKQDELQFVVEDCETDTIVTATPMLEFLGYTPKVKNLILLDKLNFKSVPEFRWPHVPEDEDLAVLLYTSGTSGRPKGVMWTHAMMQANVRQCINWTDFGGEHVVLGILPQFHSFGLTVLTVLPLTVGAKVVYAPRFVPAKILKLIREHRPTCMVMIPSMYNALLHLKDATPDDFKSLQYVVSGGEPLPHATFQGFRDRFGVTINEGYGLTETCPVTNWCRPGETREHSVGMALPEIDQRILDYNTMQFLPPNAGLEGEIVMKGPNIMRGYFKRPEETEKAFVQSGPAQGFFRTGDIGKQDEDGFLYITGRLKEMIIVGGENVFPREIEEVLNKHPAVNASGVTSMVDDMRGELPVAFVEFKEGQSASERDLLDWCRGQLASYKIPRFVKPLPTLPRNPTGKIMRRDLKKLL